MLRWLVRDGGGGRIGSEQKRMMSSYPKMVGLPRVEEGSKRCQKLRLSGRIPSVLYGVGADGARERKLLSVATKDLARELRKKHIAIENTLYELEIQGTTSLVLPRQIQIRPGEDRILSCNFLRFSPGTLVEFPLRFVDAEQNTYLKRGGFVHRVEGSVKCIVDTFDLPDYLDISVAKGARDHVFRLDDLILPPGITLKTPKRHTGVLAVIQGK